MKKIIYMSIFTTLLTLFGCKSKEQSFLDNHNVLFYKTEAFDSFVEKANIKPNIAKELMLKYSKDNNIRPPRVFCCIVDEFYVYSDYIHSKMQKVHTSGIWLNSKNGEILQVSEGVWLNSHGYNSKNE